MKRSEMKSFDLARVWRVFALVFAVIALMGCMTVTVFAEGDAPAEDDRPRFEGAELYFSSTIDGEWTKDIQRTNPATMKIYPHFVYEGKELVCGKDYDIEIRNLQMVERDPVYLIAGTGISAGERYVEVWGIGEGEYAGRIFESRINVLPTPFNEDNVKIENVSENLPYTKVMYDQHPVVYMEDYDPVYDDYRRDEIEYNLSFEDVDENTVNMIITGRGGFEGQVTVPFHVIPADINNVRVSLYNAHYSSNKKTFPYRKTAIELTSDDYFIGYTGQSGKNPQLIEGVDFVASYENNVEPGTATMTMTGIGHYYGTRTLDFEIVRHEIRFCKIEVPDVVYPGGKFNPEAFVYDELSGIRLVEGVDYKLPEPVVYSPGSHGITVSGLGGYTGSDIPEFHVLPNDDINISLEDVERFEISYNKVIPYIPKPGSGMADANVKIYDKVAGRELTWGVDFLVAEFKCDQLGESEIWLHGWNDYIGHIHLPVTIVPRDISNAYAFILGAASDGSSTFEYTGRPIIPGNQLRIIHDLTPVNIPAENYDVEFINNVEPGTATIRITGKGCLTGVKEQQFKIVKNGGQHVDPIDPIDPIDPVVNGKITLFVTRLYQGFLNRKPDEGGLKNWSTLLAEGKSTGCSVAKGFAHSPEFQNLGLDDTGYITALYHTIFGREPDEGGLNSWLTVLNNGCTRDKVLEGFLKSDEMLNLCTEAGIDRGTYKSYAVVDQNYGVTSFVSRLYLLIMGRKADSSGLESWVSILLSGKKTASEVVVKFFTSEEWKNRETTDEGFVTAAYQAVLGREPDEGGLTGWVNALANGKDRMDVLSGFLKSDEFASICAGYGVKQ